MQTGQFRGFKTLKTILEMTLFFSLQFIHATKTSSLWMVSGFLWVLWYPTSMKSTRFN